LDQAEIPELHVCVTCRAGIALADGDAPPGQLLHDALLRAANGAIRLQRVECLANCERGCSAAIAMRGKWSYLLGHLSPRHAQDLLTYAASYAASPTGTVLPSRRPDTLRHIVIGRFPPSEQVA
jgi:predicted metal-binding protein